MKQIKENNHMQWKIEKGDYIALHWYEYGGYPRFAYDVRYMGRTRNGEYKFQSPNGWNYIVSKDKRTMYNDSHDEDIYRVDPSTGWTKYLPD